MHSSIRLIFPALWIIFLSMIVFSCHVIIGDGCLDIPDSTTSIPNHCTRPDNTPPESVVLRVVEEAIDSSSITLEWEPSTSKDIAEMQVRWKSGNGIDLETSIIIHDPKRTRMYEFEHDAYQISVTIHSERTHIVIMNLNPGVQYTFYVTAIDDSGNSAVTIETAATIGTPKPSEPTESIVPPNTIDIDGDGLIDISSLDQLYNMRYNLAGTSYKTSSSDNGVMCGTALDTACSGYELMQNLDFASSSSYDSGTINMIWRPTDGDPDAATNVGWDPIGDATNAFATIFNGNGYSISNLYVRRAGTVGLFGQTNSSATIRTVGIIDNAIYGSGGDNNSVGGLVGQNGGTITASYTTGNADGGGGNNDSVGGLVGYNNGAITASYTTGNADGGGGNNDSVGGLVGYNNGAITASYATGDINGGDGTSDRVGGLVGENFGTITASYAAGTVGGGRGNVGIFGALVGWNRRGVIIASYATGNAIGGNGTTNSVGALVGYNTGTIIASYATGSADGGDTIEDYVGGLVGYNLTGIIIASYATGSTDGGGGNHDFVGGLVGRHTNGTITASYATGDASGGGGDDNVVGGLVGWRQGGTITASYGFGTLTNGDIAGIDDSGDRPSDAIAASGTGRTGAAILLAPNDADITNTAVGAAWNQESSDTAGAWDFGGASDIPTLRYADYDGAGSTYGCGSDNIATIVLPTTVPNGRGGITTITCGVTPLSGTQPR